ncbi:hypothetical protein EDD16DRAFT_1570428, partial [Pisolithus croceorrhizus]
MTWLMLTRDVVALSFPLTLQYRVSLGDSLGELSSHTVDGGWQMRLVFLGRPKSQEKTTVPSRLGHCGRLGLCHWCHGVHACSKSQLALRETKILIIAF